MFSTLKCYVVLFTCVFIHLTLNGQAQMSVKSFRVLPMDLDARVNYPQRFDNEKCALVKMVTTATNFTFDGGMLGLCHTQQKVGEVWVYVRPGARFLTIQHAQLGVIRRYEFPIDINPATTYEMVLTTAKINVIIEEKLPQFGSIRSTPAGADVYIDDIRKGTTPLKNISLVEGDHQIKITKPLYYDFETTLTVTTEAKFKPTYTLKPNFGTVTIESQPESGASIFLDGQDLKAQTPHTIAQLSSGQHTIQVRLDLYDLVQESFTIADGESKTLAFDLKPLFGSLTIKTTPSGAAIFIDGQDRQTQTPATFSKLPSGQHTVQVRLDLYDLAQQTFTITDGESKSLAFDLKPLFGNLTITTEPAADIFINGENKGNTNWQGKLVAGQYGIEIKKAKHYPEKKAYTMTIGNDETLDFALKPITGTLAVTTDPEEVTIFVDGANKGESPLYVRNLIIGEHRLKLQKANYATLEKTFTITEKQTTTVNETLPSTKTIRLTSEPSGARVYLDNTYTGTTPLELPLAYGKTYTATLKKDNCKDKTVDLSTSSGDQAVVLAVIPVTIQGQTYKTVTIGNQTWMAENLNLYIDGSSCYDDDPANCEKYGRLYSWEAARAIAAKIPGWHLPTEAEWDELCEALGGTADSDGDYRSIGTKLKNGAFNALLAGYRNSGGYFSGLGYYGYFWSASPNGSSYAWYRYVDASYSSVGRNYYYRASRSSVRLVKDD